MTSSTTERLFFFPPAPDESDVEWAGEPIGRSNSITRTKSRTLYHDKIIDRTPGRREELVNAAVEHIVRRGGLDTFYIHDVVIHGIKVRAITNSRHLIDFWRDNWYGVDEWRQLSGHEPTAQPRVVVYALGGLERQREAAYYSRLGSEVIFFNTSYYGQLKSWTLGAVGRILASEYGVHSIHGACVEKDGRGVLYIAPTGTGKSTSSYGLMTHPNTRFHSDDWVYIRYVHWTKDGRAVCPTRIETHLGDVFRGYECFEWLASHLGESARLQGLGLHDEPFDLTTDQIDSSRPVAAFAYTSEKVFYLRSNLVENFPESAYQILHADLENVPSVDASYVASRKAVLDELVPALRQVADSAIRDHFADQTTEEIEYSLARLFAFDNARAMLDISKVLPRERVFWNPMEPVHLDAVFLLKRDPTDRVVLESLSLEGFMDRLLIGATPDGKREIAYNAYRTVDDDAERRYVTALEAEARTTGEGLYHIFSRRSDVPESLREEFGLFRVLHQAAASYDLNTVLQLDPSVRSKKEAVGRTIDLIARTIDHPPRSTRLTLDDYR